MKLKKSKFWSLIITGCMVFIFIMAINAQAQSSTAFVTGQSLSGTLRNDFTGWVGTEITVGSSPITVTDLGRWVVSGNTGTHTVELVQASNGAILGSVSVPTSGQPVGFKYVTLTSSVTLASGTSYYLLTSETSGGDQWYDFDTSLTTASVATVPASAYSLNNTTFATFGSPNNSYGPVSFMYATSNTTAFVTGQSLSGTLRNDFTGWVGTEITVGTSPITVTNLGRWVVSGNTSTHTVELVQASNGAILGSVSVPTSGQPVGFYYVSLSSSVTLAANTSYYVLSLETNGGDQWYDYNNVVTTTSVATVPASAYSLNNTTFATYGSPNNSYGPVNFTYLPLAETIGGGTISSPAVGPAPSYGIGGTGFTLVKNWHFGTDGTIKNISDMNANFYYHDQFGTFNNGGNYGANIVSPDSANALSGQPVEGTNTATPVRTFFTDYLQTYLVPLNGATTVVPSSHNAGCGSFMAKWNLPNGGSLLGQDIVWETRVRYVTPPYFWFALWTSGNQWNAGAEMDLIESFGFDNGGGSTNYDGALWHSNSVGGSDNTDYSNWWAGMSASGLPGYYAPQYHIWTWVYKKDNTYQAYVDGTMVQSGTINWTLSGISGGTPINMDFLFDATWGSTNIASVNHSLAASSLAGTYYEWNYSRVYLR